jgi:hypothetical protein
MTARGSQHVWFAPEELKLQMWHTSSEATPRRAWQSRYRLAQQATARLDNSAPTQRKSTPCLLTTVLRPNLNNTHSLQFLLRCTLALPGVARRSSSAARRKAWDLHSQSSSQHHTTSRHNSHQQSQDLTQLCTLAATLRARLTDGRQSTDQAQGRI